MNEARFCPLSAAQVCRINRRECRYGLTDIHVPDHCPLPQVVSVERHSFDEEDDGISSEDVILIASPAPSGDAALRSLRADLRGMLVSPHPDAPNAYRIDEDDDDLLAGWILDIVAARTPDDAPSNASRDAFTNSCESNRIRGDG